MMKYAFIFIVPLVVAAFAAYFFLSPSQKNNVKAIPSPSEAQEMLPPLGVLETCLDVNKAEMRYDFETPEQLDTFVDYFCQCIVDDILLQGEFTDEELREMSFFGPEMDLYFQTDEGVSSHAKCFEEAEALAFPQ